jgi:hypothetical protein
MRDEKYSKLIGIIFNISPANTLIDEEERRRNKLFVRFRFFDWCLLHIHVRYEI